MKTKIKFQYNNFRNNYDGLNRYSVWILCALVSGWQICRNPASRRTYWLIKNKKLVSIQANAVNSLNSRNFIFTNHKGILETTLKGSSIAMKRIADAVIERK